MHAQSNGTYIIFVVDESLVSHAGATENARSIVDGSVGYFDTDNYRVVVAAVFGPASSEQPPPAVPSSSLI